MQVFELKYAKVDSENYEFAVVRINLDESSSEAERVLRFEVALGTLDGSR